MYASQEKGSLKRREFLGRSFDRGAACPWSARLLHWGRRLIQFFGWA